MILLNLANQIESESESKFYCEKNIFLDFIKKYWTFEKKFCSFDCA